MQNEYYAVRRTVDFLMHAGVKGMRWGYRKDDERKHTDAYYRMQEKLEKNHQRFADVGTGYAVRLREEEPDDASNDETDELTDDEKEASSAEYKKRAQELLNKKRQNFEKQKTRVETYNKKHGSGREMVNQRKKKNQKKNVRLPGRK